MLVLNDSDRDLKLVCQGVEYELPVGVPMDIPELAAKLYFAYEIEVTDDIMQACIERLKRWNPDLFMLTDKKVWDEYILNIKFNTEVTDKLKNIGSQTVKKPRIEEIL